MYILGINGGVRAGYRDASAVLIHDGDIVAAAEEERFNRTKGSPCQLPEQAIHFVLSFAKIKMKEVNIVASHGITWGDQYQNVLANFLQTNFGHAPRIKRYHHHDCHAASTYFASGFDEALILTIDNSGDGVSTQFALGRNKNEIEVLERISRPNSLGIIYGLITQYCGFRRDEDEFKLMGLASYGKPTVDLSFLISFSGGSYKVNEEYLQPILPGQSQPTYQQAIYSEKLIEKLGPQRLKGEPFTQRHRDVAASAQMLLENVVLRILEQKVKETGIKKVCLAGGVALNCAMNRKIMNAAFVDQIFIQPAAGDAGISLGAAYLASIENGALPTNMKSVALGQEFDNKEIERVLNQTQSRYQKINFPEKVAADLIAQGKVLAWFQGRSEFGPRALGYRSILANPAIKGMRDLVNKKIKFRESFRPFCPSVLLEDAEKYFKGSQFPSPYMTINYDVTELAISDLEEIVHVDKTARIQTVSPEDNALYYNLLVELKRITGHGVCMNTSFNVNHQPIVNTPIEAIMMFYGCGLDAMIIGDFLMEK